MGTETSTRAQLVRSFLRKQNLRAWLAWRPDELLMLSGAFPYWGASLLIFFADAEPVLFVPQIEPRDQVSSGLRVVEYPWGDLKCRDPFAVLIEAVKGEMKKGGIHKREEVGMAASAARISLPMQAAEQIPFAEGFAQRLADLAAPADADCASAFTALYLHKTSEEMVGIRLANRIANVGIQVFRENAKEGISETELAAAVESAVFKEIGRDGIFHARSWAHVQSGPNSADAGRFNRSMARRLQNGDLVVMEMGTCVNGYWADLTRTVAVGRAAPEAAEIFNVVKEAQQAALDGVKPGASAGSVDARARKVVADGGFEGYFTHATGHHVGFHYHDPGFALVPGEQELLEPGMVITVEPGVYVPERGAGARLEDNVLVTNDGYEMLSAAPEARA